MNFEELICYAEFQLDLTLESAKRLHSLKEVWQFVFWDNENIPHQINVRMSVSTWRDYLKNRLEGIHDQVYAEQLARELCTSYSQLKYVDTFKQPNRKQKIVMELDCES